MSLKCIECGAETGEPGTCPDGCRVSDQEQKQELLYWQELVCIEVAALVRECSGMSELNVLAAEIKTDSERLPWIAASELVRKAYAERHAELSEPKA